MSLQTVVLRDEDYDLSMIPQLEDELAVLVEERCALDLCNVHYLDTACLGTLIHALKRLRNARPASRLALLNVQPRLREVFELTRLDTLFDLEESASLRMEQVS